jgi:hypothetical protein
MTDRFDPIASRATASPTRISSSGCATIAARDRQSQYPRRQQ